MNLNALKNKIAVKLIALIAVSLLVSTLIFLILGHYVSFHFLAGPNHYWDNFVVKYNSIVLMIFLISIGIFITLFLFPVNRKLSYIQYISRELRRISSQQDLGAVVKIKGQDELAELGRSINVLSKELKRKFDHEREAEETKNELITNISHDLRSPLTSIIGYIDLIKKNRFRNEAEFNEYVDTIYNKSQNLKLLIDELFEYTKLSNPGLSPDFRKVELGGLLEQILGEYTPIFEREGLTIKKDFPLEDLEVDLDAEKIIRVFENLLANARKYSSKPSEIRVVLSTSRDKVRISFMNNVNKLPAQDPEKLFERFYKGDASRGEEQSSGLGLAIAKKIVELHGGSIWANYLSDTIEFIIEIPTSPEFPLSQ